MKTPHVCEGPRFAPMKSRCLAAPDNKSPSIFPSRRAHHVLGYLYRRGSLCTPRLLLCAPRLTPFAVAFAPSAALPATTAVGLRSKVEAIGRRFQCITVTCNYDKYTANLLDAQAYSICRFRLWNGTFGDEKSSPEMVLFCPFVDSIARVGLWRSEFCGPSLSDVGACACRGNVQHSEDCAPNPRSGSMGETAGFPK